MKKWGRASRSSSSTNSPATTSAWQAQLRYFGRRYRPSPTTRAAIRRPTCRTTRSAIRRIRRVTTSAPSSTRLSIDKAHLVGLSMGGLRRAAFRVHLSRPRALPCHRRMRLRRRAREAAAVQRRERGVGAAFRDGRHGRGRQGLCARPARVQFQNKDPRGWRQFVDDLARHSSRGSALTLRGVQGRRPRSTTSSTG